MDWLQAIILGILQGLTEFLPVSSSGHLELGKAILNIDIEDDMNNMVFTVFVHGATVLSTIVVFRKDLWNLIKKLFEFKWNEETQFVSKILLSMIPVIVVGILWEDKIDALFGGRIILVGIMLIVTATVLFLTRYAKINTGKEVTFKNAIIIGIAQTIAIMPGISRSGSTIGTALLLGVDKEKATRFSFLMVLLPILGATALKVKDIFEISAAETIDISITPLIVGFIAAFISGLLACTWMIKIVKKGKLIWFSVYCLIIGTIAIISGLV
jgi:undecaprenyl-diphosphatase